MSSEASPPPPEEERGSVGVRALAPTDEVPIFPPTPPPAPLLSAAAAAAARLKLAVAAAAAPGCLMSQARLRRVRPSVKSETAGASSLPVSNLGDGGW